MKIGNNLNGINFLEQARQKQNIALERVAAQRDISGKDSANLLIADSLMSQLGSLSQGVQNSNEAVGMLQIADSAVSSLREGSDKLNQLAVRSNSASLNSSQQAMLKQEFDATKNAMMDIVDNTSYNGKSLFDQDMSISTGESSININLSDISLEDVSIDSTESIKNLNELLDQTSSSIGSATNALNVTVANQMAAFSNVANAKSNLDESDIVKDLMQINAQNVKIDAATIAQNHKTDILQQQMQALLG